MTLASGSTVTLPRIFDLDALGAVREHLHAALPNGPVTVEAGAVERVSTNGLFLLLAAARSARAKGQALTLEAPSAAFLAALAQLGMQAAFSDLAAGRI